MNQQDQQLVLAQTVGSGGVWLEDATAVALPGGQVVVPGLLLFGVEPPPPPPPPPLSAAEQALARQLEKQEENEAKFNKMIAELSNATTRQMAGMHLQIVMLGEVAGKKMLDVEGKIDEKLSETAATILSTQKQVLQFGHSQESTERATIERRESER